MTPRLVLVLSENWTLTPPRDLRALVEMAVVAEEAGFDAVMVSEHIVLGPSAGANGIMGNPRDYALPGQPGSRDAVAELARPALGDRGRDDAAAARRLRGDRAAPAPAAARARARHARPALGGPPRRAADRELAPRRVRGARRSVRPGAAPCSTSISPRGKVSGATRRRRFAGEHYALRRTSTSSRRRGARTGRGSGSAASRCTRRSCVGSSATPTASIRSASRPTRTWLLLRDGLTAAGRDLAELELVGGMRAVFPDDDSPSPLAPAIASLPAQQARGFTTFCIKPSQFVDDIALYPAWCREVVERVGELGA